MWVYKGTSPKILDDFSLEINNKIIKCSKTVCIELSKTISSFVYLNNQNDNNSKNDKDQIIDNKYSFVPSFEIDNSLIEKLFTGQNIKIVNENVQQLSELAKLLNIESLGQVINDYSFRSIEKFEEILFAWVDSNITPDSIGNIVTQFYELRFINYNTISHLIMNCCFSRSSKCDDILNLLFNFDKLLTIRNNPSIIPSFHDAIISTIKLNDKEFLFKNELFFIARRLIDKEIIGQSELVIFDLPYIFNDLYDLIDNSVNNEENNIDYIMKNHKERVKDGKSDEKSAVLIRNDDDKEFIRLYKNGFFEDNIIKANHFERVTLVNTGYCTFIEYAAFFGSKKIFNFLFDNLNEKPESLPIFAVAGGCLDIIEKCYNASLNFDCTLNTAIEFHQLSAFNFIYDKKQKSVSSSMELTTECILYSNFCLLFFLISNSLINFSKTYIPEIAKSDSIELMKWAYKKDEKVFNKSINAVFEKLTSIQFACYNNSIEMVQFLLFNENCNINIKTKTTTLNCAVDSNNMKILELIINKGVENINEKDESGYSALHQSVMKNNYEATKLLLNQKFIDYNQWTRKEKMTPLHICCQNGFFDIFQLLVSMYNIQLNTFSVNGMTPLHSAIENDFTEIVAILLKDLLIDINTINDIGDSPIHTAVKNRNCEIVKMLIEKEVEINVQNAELLGPIHISLFLDDTPTFNEIIKSKHIEVNSKGSGWTPLHIVCKTGNINILKALLSQKGINLNPTGGNDIDGELPIHIAIKYNHDQIVQELLATNKIYINMKNKIGLCPIHIAIENKNITIIKQLLTKTDINLNMKNNEGETAFHQALKSRQIDIAKLLISIVGININELNNDLMNILQIACQINEVDFVKLLLNKFKDIDVNNKNKFVSTYIYQMTALHFGCQNKSTEIVKCLLEWPTIEINPRAEYDITPLHIAVENACADIVDLFFNCKKKISLDVNAKTCDGQTPLHVACSEGYTNIVDMFIKEGHCNVNSQTNDGDTPLHYAADGNHKEIIIILLRHKEIQPNITNNNGVLLKYLKKTY